MPYLCSFPESQTFLLLLGNSFDDQYDFDEDDDMSLFWHDKLGNRGWGLPVVKGGGGAVGEWALGEQEEGKRHVKICFYTNQSFSLE